MAKKTAVKECWCGEDHNADGQNGNFKHWAMNWALYRIRMDDLERATPTAAQQGTLAPKSLPLL